MTEAADDLRERMENQDMDLFLHENGRCEPDCPYCQCAWAEHLVYE